MKSEDSNQSMMAFKLDHINSSWSQGMGVCAQFKSHLRTSEALSLEFDLCV